MKRKDKINQGTVRKLTETETVQVVGGYFNNNILSTNQNFERLMMQNCLEGNYKGGITPSRKGLELLPSSGVKY